MNQTSNPQRGQAYFNNTTVNLDRSRVSRAFSREESLWEPEITRIMDLIQTHSELMENKIANPEMPNLSIAIFGTYGAGKSSLLHTLKMRINEESVRPNIHLKSLPVIEPNILNKKDRFLYSFLATALEEHHKNRQGPKEGKNESQVLSRVQKSFLSLSEHLKVIDDSADAREVDPHEISMSRLERHNSGILLKKNLNNFLDKLIMDLAGDTNPLLLMPVDDADMSMDELISTLDTLRRYLQHPRLIPIFTFTGRLAEELLRVNFNKKLQMGKYNEADKLKELTELTITESLALQYLGKLFPVRNRIRLGFAAARAQSGKFSGKFGTNASYSGSKEEDKDKEVMEFLKIASTLLFGFSNWPLEPSIYAALRAANLRRQIQIIDAINASGIHFFDKNGDANLPLKDYNSERYVLDLILERRVPAWVNVFDGATWALLNVHRDVLREFELNLDDLYSWTPVSLRQVILTKMLGQDKDTRKKLVKMWQCKTENRRSQLLSLMAVNLFRPRMLVEETTGDDPHQITMRNNLNREIEQKESGKLVIRALTTSFSTREGVLWFLNLWTGFYLPQTLFMHDQSSEVTEANSIGWDLDSGPNQAIEHLIENDQIHSIGSMRIKYDQFAALAKSKDDEMKGKQFSENNYKELVSQLKSVILLNIWCNVGSKDSESWAVLSLWRGLGLLGQILKVDIEMRATYLLEKPYEHRYIRKERIKKVIQNHFRSVISNKESGIFQEWHFEGSYKTVIDILTDDILHWMDGFDPEFQRIYPMWPAEFRSDERDVRECIFKDLRSNLEDEIDKRVDVIKKDIEDKVKSVLNDWKKEDTENFGDKSTFENKWKDMNSGRFVSSVNQFKIKGNDQESTVFELIQFIVRNLERPLKQFDFKIYQLELNIFEAYEYSESEEDSRISKDSKRFSRDQLFKELLNLKKKREFAYEDYSKFAELLRSFENKIRLDKETYPPVSHSRPKELSDSNLIEFKKDLLNWQSCFIRRLHGHEIVGRFVTDLQDIQSNISVSDINAYQTLKSWLSVLVNYWNCGIKWADTSDGEIKQTKREPKVVSLIASCPFVRPFAELSLNKELEDGSPPNFGLLEFEIDQFVKIRVEKLIKNPKLLDVKAHDQTTSDGETKDLGNNNIILTDSSSDQNKPTS